MRQAVINEAGFVACEAAFYPGGTFLTTKQVW